MTNDKINILDSSEKHGVVSEIKTKDYITVHKAKVESLKSDDKALNLGAEVFDKLGAAILGGIVGVLITVDKIGDASPAWIFTGILGAAALLYGIYAKHQRNNKINDFISKALEENEII